MTAHSLAAPSASPAPQHSESYRFVIASLGSRRFALPAGAVERIVRMAALTPLPRPPRRVVGVLNLEGTALLVVDPRRVLGIARTRPSAAQQLIVLRARTRFVLWVDRVEDLVFVAPADVEDLAATRPQALSAQVLRRGGELLIPILSAAALDPGPWYAPRTATG
jgi:chemotaxis signal transduction protein